MFEGKDKENIKLHFVVFAPIEYDVWIKAEILGASALPDARCATRARY